MNFFAPIDMVFPANWNSAGACSSLCPPEHFAGGPLFWGYVALVVCGGVAAFLASRGRSTTRR